MGWMGLRAAMKAGSAMPKPTDEVIARRDIQLFVIGVVVACVAAASTSLICATCMAPAITQ